MLDTNTFSQATSHTVKTGDTWSRITQTHLPAGVSPDLYAEYVRLLNGGKLTNGRTILV